MERRSLGKSASLQTGGRPGNFGALLLLAAEVVSQRSGNVPVRADLITGGANEADQLPIVARVDLAANLVDVDVDDIGHTVDVQSPKLFDEGRAADGVAGA